MPLLRVQVSNAIVYWGNANNYPQEVILMALKSPELLSMIEYLVTVIYGDGLKYQIYGGTDSKGNHIRLIITMKRLKTGYSLTASKSTSWLRSSTWFGSTMHSRK